LAVVAATTAKPPIATTHAIDLDNLNRVVRVRIATLVFVYYLCDTPQNMSDA
jgi:hypothetical protein